MGSRRGDDRPTAPAGDAPSADPTSATSAAKTPPRRSPTAGERKRDPHRTRERILDAALQEFSEHGYAGARVSAIASRAGVNQQLISYYFDGKAGLFQSLAERWRTISDGLNRTDMPLRQVVDNFLAAGVEQRPWARLLAWEGLTGGAESDADDAFFAAMVNDARRRQRAGELAADLDPAYVLLALFMAASAPTMLPQVVRRLTGLPADSAEFLKTYREQLGRIVDRLAD
ncbi:TetR/AcrR family transcriptional regulator [Micromonospora zhanjiangensis]|uniref:TetR/AcrR family transcriptional regulator n=1 Tax=Micromonospora zhanjiangensis TaxID=1522057 RepID=A0ABV8KX68_9ACTN